MDSNSLKEAVLPSHPNFDLIDYSENILNAQKSRLLITMQKKS